MDKVKALQKLQDAKINALANSTNIIVGRLELNVALEALKTIIALEQSHDINKNNR